MFSWYHCYIIVTIDKPEIMAISWHFSSWRSTTESTSRSSGWNSMLPSLKNLTENTLENEAERPPKRKVAVVWPPFFWGGFAKMSIRRTVTLAFALSRISWPRWRKRRIRCFLLENEVGKWCLHVARCCIFGCLHNCAHSWLSLWKQSSGYNLLQIL